MRLLIVCKGDLEFSPENSEFLYLNENQTACAGGVASDGVHQDVPRAALLEGAHGGQVCGGGGEAHRVRGPSRALLGPCLLYTSDAADE